MYLPFSLLLAVATAAMAISCSPVSERHPTGSGSDSGFQPLLNSNYCNVWVRTDVATSITFPAPPGSFEPVHRIVSGLQLETSEVEYPAGSSPNLDFYDLAIGPFPYYFDFVDVSARHPFELYIAGTVSATGDCILEKWEFSSQVGGYYSYRDTSSSGIGTPSALSELTAELVGDVYIPPVSRTDPVTLQRTEIYQGALDGDVQHVAVDPEGRFVLLTDSTGKLYQLAGLQSPTLSVLYDSTSLPGLETVTEFRPFIDGNGVRCYLAAAPVWDEGGVAYVLRDTDNDGVFDEALMYTRGAFEASAYGPSNWLEDYVNYEI